MRAMRSHEYVQHQQIDRAVKFREQTGRCLICHEAAAEGVTCGHGVCLQKWIRGRFPRLEIKVEGMEVLRHE